MKFAPKDTFIAYHEKNKLLYEFFVKTKNKPNVLAAVAGVFGENGINILASSAVGIGEVGYLYFFVDLSHTTIKIENIVEALKNLGVVLEVKVRKGFEDGLIVDELSYPVTLCKGERNAVIIPYNSFINNIICDKCLDNNKIKLLGLSIGKEIASFFSDNDLIESIRLAPDKALYILQSLGFVHIIDTSYSNSEGEITIELPQRNERLVSFIESVIVGILEKIFNKPVTVRSRVEENVCKLVFTLG